MRCIGGVFKSVRGPNTSVTRFMRLRIYQNDISFYPAFSMVVPYSLSKTLLKVVIVHSLVKGHRHVVTVISGAIGNVIGWGLLM